MDVLCVRVGCSLPSCPRVPSGVHCERGLRWLEPSASLAFTGPIREASAPVDVAPMAPMACGVREAGRLVGVQPEAPVKEGER